MKPVGRGALAVAAVRAAESRRPDRLFHDPFAASFVADSEDTYGPVDFDDPDPRRRALLRGIVIRTRFFDDLLIRTARQCPQVVLLGAGLDARAFRLAWPEATTLFELDTGDVLESALLH